MKRLLLTIGLALTCSAYLFAAVLATDSFTGTNGTNVQDHTSDSGATYGVQAGFTGNMTIGASNDIYSTSIGNSAEYYVSAVPSTADYSVRMDYVVKTHSSGNYYWITCRQESVNDTYYGAVYTPDLPGWSLELIQSGTTTLYNQYTQTVTDGVTYQIELNCYGSSIDLKVDTVLRASFTDSTLTAVGHAGFGSYSASGIDNTSGIHFDNFLLSDATAAHKSHMMHMSSFLLLRTPEWLN